MITINLIPYRAARRKELIIQQSVIAAIPIVLALVIFFCLWMFNNSRISAAENEIATKKKQIEECTLQMKEIDDYKAKKEVLLKKMDVISNLQKSKNGPVHLLDELATSIPGNLWLISVRQKGMALEIEGLALDNIAVSNYMINLEKSPYITNVDLKSINADSSVGKTTVPLKRFFITCTVTYAPKKMKAG